MTDENFDMNDVIEDVDQEDQAQILQEDTDEVWSGDDWSWSGHNSWLWGGALIFVGVALLLQNVLGWSFIHWWNFWAIFLIVPGVNMLLRAYNQYKPAQTLNQSSRKTFIFGSLLTLIGFSFLLDISFSFVWPVFFIAIGLYMLVSYKK